MTLMSLLNIVNVALRRTANVHAIYFWKSVETGAISILATFPQSRVH